MRIFTVYRNPSDFPGWIVVREFVIGETSTPKAIEQPLFAGPDSPRGLAAARQKIRNQGDFFRLDRSLHDEPQIVEVWL